MEHTRPQRKSPRLRAYDYTQSGTYFVTICTNERIDWFGQIIDDEMRVNDLGQIADAELQAIPDHYRTVQLDLSVVMPNHIHAIIVLVGTPFMASATAASASPTRSGAHQLDSVEARALPHVPTLGQVIGAYKAGITRSGRESGVLHGTEMLWQARYHDHIIRNDDELARVQRYIAENPAQWALDTENRGRR